MRFIKLQGALVDPEMVESIYPGTRAAMPKDIEYTVVHMVSGHRFWIDKTQDQVLDILYPPPPEREAYEAPESEYMVVAPYVQSIVACPRCQVIPGYLCRTPTGNLATYPHQERQEAYSAGQR